MQILKISCYFETLRNRCNFSRLIDYFLGRKISLKLQTIHGIVLSPLVLVLNTLVSEFLYTQNCQFTLSVFTNEVPYKNTLPDFTKSDQFRFSQVEMKEIFDALGMGDNEEITKRYQQSQDPSKSFLYIIFKYMLSFLHCTKEQERVGENKKEGAEMVLDEVKIDKLHKNIEKLLHKVKTVSKDVEKLEEICKNTEISIVDKEDETSIKQASENITEIINRLENCTKNFEQISETIKENEKLQEKIPKTYKEFLNLLKTTEFGQKYIKKLQKTIFKLMEKEKSKMETEFQKRVHEIELEYKTKMESFLTEKLNAEVIIQEKEVEIVNNKGNDYERLVFAVFYF